MDNCVETEEYHVLSNGQTICGPPSLAEAHERLLAAQIEIATIKHRHEMNVAVERLTSALAKLQTARDHNVWTTFEEVAMRYRIGVLNFNTFQDV